jgi:hypothetical protein
MLMHTCAIRSYLSGGYLPAENIIRYGIFQNKLVIFFKGIILLILPKKIRENIAIQTT